MKRLYLLFFSVCFCASLFAQQTSPTIASKADLIGAMSNFPADSEVRAYALSNFEQLSENQLTVIERFNTLFSNNNLTQPVREGINAKAVAIIVNGTDDLINNYVKNSAPIGSGITEDEALKQLIKKP